MKHHTHNPITLITLSVLLAVGGHAQTWINPNGGEWGVADNWNPASVPGAAGSYDSATFTTISGDLRTVTLGGNYKLNQLFGTIGGQKTLVLSGPTGVTSLVFGGADAAITVNGDMTLQVDADLALDGDLTLDAAAGRLVLGEAYTLATNGYNLSVSAEAGKRVEILRSFGGAGTGLVKTGLGTLYLGGGNSFDGGVTVKSGILQVGHDLALGSGTLTLGDSASPTAGVTLEAVGADRKVANDLAWDSNSLYMVGNYELYLDGAGRIDLASDRTVDVSPQATLTFGENINFGGSGKFAKTGAGTLNLLGADNTFTEFTLSAGSVLAGNGNGHFTFGAADPGHNPLGTGDLNISGPSSRLQVFAGIIGGRDDYNWSHYTYTELTEGWVSLQGGITLDYGATFEVLSLPRVDNPIYPDGGMYLYGVTETRIEAGAVLDGGAHLSGAGKQSQFILHGDVVFNGGSFLNAPELHLVAPAYLSGSNYDYYGGHYVEIYGQDYSMYTNSVSLVSGTGMAAGVGRLVLRAGNSGEDAAVALAPGVLNFGAAEIYVDQRTLLALAADHQIRLGSGLTLSSRAALYSGGYAAEFADLAWTDSAVWGDSSNLVLSGVEYYGSYSGSAITSGELYFSGSTRGGLGNLLVRGWQDGKDHLLFDADISGAEWFDRLKLTGYNWALGNEVVAYGDGRYELRPVLVNETATRYEWNAQADFGEGYDKKYNTSAEDGGNWDMNRKPDGVGVEMVFGGLDANLAGKGIYFNYGQYDSMTRTYAATTLGRLTVTDDATAGNFSISGGPWLFDNNGAAGVIDMGASARTLTLSPQQLRITGHGLSLQGSNTSSILSISGVISGSGNLNVDGAGIWRLSANSGTYTMYGNVSGSSAPIGTGTYFTGTTFLNHADAWLQIGGTAALGSGPLVINAENAAISGNNATAAARSIKNQLIWNSSTLRIQGAGSVNYSLALAASGDPAKDVITLDVDKTIALWDSVAATLTFNIGAGRSLQGTGGLRVEAYPTGGGVSVLQLVDGNNTFSGGLTLATNIGHGDSSENLRVDAGVDGSARLGDLTLGAVKAGENFLGTGDITFVPGNPSNAGIAILRIFQQAGKTVTFTGGMTVSNTSGNWSWFQIFGGGGGTVKMDDVNFYNNNSELFFYLFGSRVLEINEDNVNFNLGPGRMDLRFENSNGSGASGVGDSVIKSVGTTGTIGTLKYVRTSGYTLTVDPSVNKLIAGTFIVTNSRLQLTNDDQVSYNTLQLETAGRVNTDGYINQFGNLNMVGNSSLELGDSGQLIFSGSISGWTAVGGLLVNLNITGSHNYWNTASVTDATERVWFTGTTGWNAARLEAVAFTGYTRGAELIARSGTTAAWELVTAGNPGNEWVGAGGTSNTKWSTTNNWTPAVINSSTVYVPDGDGHIAIFRDADVTPALSGKNIQLDISPTLWRIDIESANRPGFTISGSAINFAAYNGTQARLNIFTPSTLTISAPLKLDGGGLYVNNVGPASVTLSGHISESAPGAAMVYYSTNWDYTLYVNGSNSFTGGFTTKGTSDTVVINNSYALGTGTITFNSSNIRFSSSAVLANDTVFDAGWFVSRGFTLNDDNPNDDDGFLARNTRLTADGATTFGPNYRLVDGGDGNPKSLIYAYGNVLTMQGQNTFSGGFLMAKENAANLRIGASSVLIDPADPSQGILSGPLGTGTWTLNSAVVGVVSTDGGNYTIHNPIIVNGHNSLVFRSNVGNGSLTLDSYQPLKFNSTLDYELLSDYLVIYKTQIIDISNYISVTGSSGGYSRFYNTGNVFKNFNIGRIATYTSGYPGEGRLSIAADNVVNDEDMRIGVYAWSNTTLTAWNASYIQVYGADRKLDNFLDLHSNLTFESLKETGDVPGGVKISDTLKLSFTGSGYSDLNANLVGSGGTTNQRTFNVVSPFVSGSYTSSPDAVYGKTVVSFGADHDLINGGLRVYGGNNYYAALRNGMASELELLGSKSFRGFTGNWENGDAFLGAGYDTDKTKYALVVENYGLVTTTLSGKDMVIGGVDTQAGEYARVTPFGQGEVYIGSGTALVRTAGRDVYLEDALFEIAGGALEVTGGGDLYLGVKQQIDSAGSVTELHFNQKLSGANGMDGSGFLDATDGSRIIVDTGAGGTLELRAGIGGAVVLRSGVLEMTRANGLSRVSDLLLSGGIINLNQYSQSLQAEVGTLSLALTTGEINFKLTGEYQAVQTTLTFADFGDWSNDGALFIKNWRGLATGNGDDRIVLTNVSDPTQVFGNISFAGYGDGAKLVGVGGGWYELVPYADTFVWTGQSGEDATDWTLVDNWRDHQSPNAASDAVIFGDEATALTARLPAGRTVGSISFGGTADQQFVIAGDNSTPLVLDQSAATLDASITLTNNSDARIEPALYLKKNLRLTNEAGADLELRGAIYHDSGTALRVTKTGAGVLTLSSGENNFSGGLALNQGALRINADETLSNGVVVKGAVGIGDLVIGAATEVAAVGADRTVSNRVVIGGDFTVGGAQTLTLGYNPTVSGNASTLNQDTVITVGGDAALVVAADNRFAGPGKLTKAGAGALEWHSVLDSEHASGIRVNAGSLLLSASNGYLGNTELAGGLLAVSDNRAMSSGTLLALGSGTLLAAADLNSVVNDVNVAGGVILTIQNADQQGTAKDLTLAGIISGNGSVLKTGGGTLTLTASNSYSGTTTVSEGALVLAAAAAAGVSDLSVLSDLYLDFTGTMTNTLSGSGALSKIGSGTATLSGASSAYSGNSQLQSGGLAVANNHALGSGTLTMSDATTLIYNAGIDLGNAVTVNDSGTFHVASGTATQSGSISGADIWKTGTGTLTLTAANDYTGTTTIISGELQLGDGGSTGSILALSDTSKVVTIGSGAALVFNRGDNITISGTNFIGGGAVVQRGGGELLFDVPDTELAFTGGVMVESGTMKVRHNTTLSGTITIESDGTFVFGENEASGVSYQNFTLANAIAGDGVLVLDPGEESYLVDDLAQIQFGSSNPVATANGLNFHGTVEIRHGAYRIDVNSTNFLNAGTSSLRTAAGSYGTLQNNGGAARRIEGGVEFAGGVFQWNFDSTNNPLAYISAGNIAITQSTTFRLSLQDRVQTNTSGSQSLASLFDTVREGADSLLLAESDTAIGGAMNWADLYYNTSSPGGGAWKPLSEPLRQGISQNDTEVARGVFDWTAISATGAFANQLRVGYALDKLEVFKDSTLELALTDGDTTNRFQTEITDYIWAGSATNDGPAYQAKEGSGSVRFTDLTGARGIVLDSTNSYTGTTTISDDTTLTLGNDEALGSGTRHTVLVSATGAGAVLDVNGQTANVGGVNIANGAQIDLHGGTLNILDNAAGQTGVTAVAQGGGTVSGNNALTGSGALNLNFGKLAVSGSNGNLHGSGSIASTATASLNHAQGLGDSVLTVSGLLEFVGATGTNLNAISGSGLVSATSAANVVLGGSNSAFTGTWSIANDSNFKAISERSLGAGKVNISGTLTLGAPSSPTAWALNTANTISGPGAVAKEDTNTVTITHDSGTAGTLLINNGTLAFTGSGKFTTTGSAVNRAALSVSGSARLNAGTQYAQGPAATLTVDTNNRGVTDNYVTANTATLGGTLNMLNFAAFVNSGSASGIVANNGALQYILSTTGGTISGSFASVTGVDQPAQDYLYGGGQLINSGSTYAVGYGLRWYAPDDTLNSGTFTVGSGSSFVIDALPTLSGQAGVGLVDVGGAQFGWDGKSLTKEGAGTLVLSATNTYSGSTTVNGGVLNVTGWTGSTSSVAVAGGTVNVSGLLGAGGAVTVGAGVAGELNVSGNGTVTAGGGITVGNGSVTVSGSGLLATDTDITLGTGSLTVSGSGLVTAGGIYTQNANSTLTLDLAGRGANDALVYANTLTAGGTLAVTNATSISGTYATASAVASSALRYLITATGGTVSGTFADITVNGISNSAINAALPDYLYGGVFKTVSGTSYVLGIGLRWLADSANGSGSFTVGSGSAFTVDIALSDTTGAAAYASGWDGKTLTKAGDGLLLITSSNNFSGGVLVNGGTLELQNLYGAGSGMVNVSAVLDLSGTGSYANTTTGSGTATISGSVQLSGSNSIANWLIIGTGLVTSQTHLGNGVVTIADGNLTVSADTWTFVNPLTGDGTLTVNLTNSGTFNFATSATHATAFTGTVDLRSGFFQLDNVAAGVNVATATGTGVMKNATLLLGASGTTLADSGTYRLGGLSFAGGVLKINMADAVTTGGALTVGDLAAPGGSVVQLDNYDLVSGTTPAGQDWFYQDSGSAHALLVGASGNVTEAGQTLALQDFAGNAIGDPNLAGISQNGGISGTASYSYRGEILDDGTRKGLYVTYGLTELAANSGTFISVSNAGSAGDNLLTAKLTGSGGFVFNGTGAYRVGNANSDFTGSASIVSGSLIAHNNHALGRASQMSNAAWYDLNGYAQTVGSLNNSGALNFNGGTFTISGSGGNSTSTGALSGSGALIVQSNTLTVSGSNPLLADTTINAAATVILDHVAGLGTGGVTANGLFVFNAASGTNVNTISGSGLVSATNAANVILAGSNSAFTRTGSSAHDSTLTAVTAISLGTGKVTVSGTLTLGAPSSPTAWTLNPNTTISGTGQLVKDAPNTVTISHSNSYSGGSIINSGELNLANLNGVGTGNIANSATLRLSANNGIFANNVSGAGVNIISGTGVTVSGTNGTFTGTWNVTGSGTMTSQQNLGAAGNTAMNIAGDLSLILGALDYDFNQPLTGSGTLRVQNTGTLNFVGTTGTNFTGNAVLQNNRFNLSGNNTLTLTDATLTVGEGNYTVVGTGTQNIGNLTLNSGTIQFTLDASGTQAAGLVNTGTLTLSGSTVVVVNTGSFNRTLPLLQQDERQSIQLVASTAHSGATQVSGSNLLDQNGNQLTAATQKDIVQSGTVTASGTYDFGATVSGSGLVLAYQLTALDLLAGQTTVLNEDNGLVPGSELHAAITGSGHLRISSTGALGITVNGANNTYSGTTFADRGTLIVGVNNALGNTAQLHISSTATVRLKDNTQITQTVGSLDNSGLLDFGGGTLTISGTSATGTPQNSTSTGTLSGSGALIVQSNTLTVSGSNPLLADTTISAAATVILNHAAGLGSGGVTDNGLFVFNAASGTNLNAISGSGLVSATNAANVILGGSNSAFTGTRTIANNSNLKAISANSLGTGKVTVSGTLTLGAPSSPTADWTLNPNTTISGDGKLVKDAPHTVTISHSNSYIGGSVINGGELNLANLNGSGTGNIANSATLRLSGSGIFANNISGPGVNTVSGTVDVSGSNSLFTGTWAVTASGSALFSGTHNLGGALALDVNGAATLGQLAGDYTFTPVLGGSGTLTVDNTGTFNFAVGTGSDFAGVVVLQHNRFTLDGDNTLALANATLTVGEGNHTVIGSGTQGIGNLTLSSGTIAFTLSGSNATQAEGIVNTGTLTLSGSTVVVINTGSFNQALSLLQQDEHQDLRLVASTAHSGATLVSGTNLLDQNGNQLTYATQKDIMQGGALTASGTYDFAATVSGSGLYLGYQLTDLELLAGRITTLNEDNGLILGSELHALVSGSGNLRVSSTGELGITINNGANSYTGTTFVASGTLVVGNSGALGNTALLDLAGGVTVDLNNGKSQSVGAFNGAANSTLNLNGELTLSGANGNSLSNGTLTGSGTVNVNNANFTVSGSNSISGLVNIGAPAVVTVDNVSGLGSSEIAISGSLVLSTTNSGELANRLSGTGALVKQGTASVTIAQANDDFTGSALVSGGTLTLADLAAAGTADLSVLSDASVLIVNVSGALQNNLGGAGALELLNSSLTVYDGTTVDVGQVNLVNGSVALDTTGSFGRNVRVDAASQVNFLRDGARLGHVENHGLLNFGDGGGFKTVTVGDLSGGGVIVMNVNISAEQGDRLVTGSATGTHGLALNRLDQPGSITGKEKILLIETTDSSAGAFVSGTLVDGMYGYAVVDGASNPSLDGNANHWWLMGSGLNIDGRVIISVAGAASLGWFAEQDSLLKRLGDLRLDYEQLDDRANFAKHAEGDVWVRAYGQQVNAGGNASGASFRDTLWGTDIGADKLWQLDQRNLLYTGVYGGYGQSSLDFRGLAASAESNSYQGGVYATWLHEAGWYADLVGKAAYLDNSFEVYDQGGRNRGEYNNWAAGAALELGRKIQLPGQWFIEPQAQAGYAHVFGSDYATQGGNSIKVSQGDADILQVRFGSLFGKLIRLHGVSLLQPYVKVMGVEQFSSGGTVRADDGRWRPNYDGLRAQLGAGLIWQLDEQNQLHLDYEAEFGDKFDKPWGVNAGYRYQF
ncbi:MAG: autotransporter-associated beta strand repeat-containing protein [Verrucomicrobiales bacterium]|jgi:autotransporter-associated beta strand protein|nr:autotransporter-associated beta strand repeat-containing protein [Verrucomicrobiales bacterium]